MRPAHASKQHAHAALVREMRELGHAAVVPEHDQVFPPFDDVVQVAEPFPGAIDIPAAKRNLPADPARLMSEIPQPDQRRRIAHHAESPWDGPGRLFGSGAASCPVRTETACTPARRAVRRSRCPGPDLPVRVRPTDRSNAHAPAVPVPHLTGAGGPSDAAAPSGCWWRA